MNKLYKVSFITLLIFTAVNTVFALPEMAITGSVEWDAQRVNAVVSLDMVSAGLRLPVGRAQGEALLRAGYATLILPALLELQVNSSSTIGDLVDKGELSLAEVNELALGAASVAPALSPDMRRLTASHSISLVNISSALLRHTRPSPVLRTLNPVSAAQYTGIVIIALEELPVHGMRRTTTAVPCLFPKIWDSEMNLIYDSSMLEVRDTAMVRYSAAKNIFQNNPSGLSDDLQQLVGERPLRIFARGSFGIKPTDLIIDRSDALLIISSEENRRLLSQGRVAIILDESVLSNEF